MYSPTVSLTSAVDGGWWSTPRAGRFTSGKDPVPIALEAGWAPGLVWIGAESLVPTGIRSPDLPARSESLYRLSCRGPRVVHYVYELVSIYLFAFIAALIVYM